MDGLRLSALDGSEAVEAFISAGCWTSGLPQSSTMGQNKVCSVTSTTHSANGTSSRSRVSWTRNISEGAWLNRQHPFVEVLVSDIEESGETMDISGLVRAPLPPAFHRIRRAEPLAGSDKERAKVVVGCRSSHLMTEYVDRVAATCRRCTTS